MEKCKNCGHINEQDALFCEECGSPLAQQSETVETPVFTGEIDPTEPINEGTIENEATEKVEKPTVAPVASKPAQPKEPLTKKQKMTYGAIIGVVLILFAVYSFAKSYYSYDSQVDRYLNALNSGEASQIAKVVSTKDINFDVTKDSIQPFADYINGNNEYMSQITNRLSNEYSSSDPSYAVYLEQKGKALFFFDKYDLVMNPIYVTAMTNMADTVMTLNGEEFATSDEENFSTNIGPLAPGIHVFHAINKGEISTLESEITRELIGDGDVHNEYQVDMSLTGVEFTISSNVSDAKVFLDGKEIGQLEDGTAHFGPIAWNEESKLTVKKDFPSGELETAPQRFEEYDMNYTFNFLSVTDYEMEQKLGEIYGYTFYSSYYDNDTDGLEELLVDGTENSIYKTFTNNLKKFEDDEEIQGVRYNANVQSVEQTDQNEFKVTYDLHVTTNYTYDSDKSRTEEEYTFDAVVIAENIEETGTPSHPYNFDLKLKSAALAE